MNKENKENIKQTLLNTRHHKHSNYNNNDSNHLERKKSTFSELLLNEHRSSRRPSAYFQQQTQKQNEASLKENKPDPPQLSLKLLSVSDDANLGNECNDQKISSISKDYADILIEQTQNEKDYNNNQVNSNNSIQNRNENQQNTSSNNRSFHSKQRRRSTIAFIKSTFNKTSLNLNKVNIYRIDWAF